MPSKAASRNTVRAKTTSKKAASKKAAGTKAVGKSKTTVPPSNRSKLSIVAEDNAGRIAPRRASLSQERSRQTRRRLVRAAIRLWNERGFDDGFDDTTVEEIARTAGVTKGTFYFHFAAKDDILLELGWATADGLYNEAIRSVGTGRSGLALVDQLLLSLARRVESVPHAAIVRVVAEFYGQGIISRRPPGRLGIGDSFAVALEAAREQGEVPSTVDVEDLARSLTALAMDALLSWASGDKRRLRAVLRSRADILIRGAEATAPDASARRGRSTSAR
jgi:AcrR family transcriptional regulator